MPRLSFNARESTGFEAWPAGTYPLRILKAAPGTSRNNSNPQLVLDFECIEGPYEGKKRKAWITFTDKSGFDLEPLLEAAIPGQYDRVQIENDSEGNKRFNYEFESDDLIDKVINVDMTQYTDEKGVVQNRLKFKPYSTEPLPQAQAENGGVQVQQEAPVQERQATERRRVTAA